MTYLSLSYRVEMFYLYYNTHLKYLINGECIDFQMFFYVCNMPIGDQKCEL